MVKRISITKSITICIVSILSVLVLYYNNTLRVPSIFDGKFYTTAIIKPSPHPKYLPEKSIGLPDVALWLDSASAVRYPYPDFFYKAPAQPPS